MVAQEEAPLEATVVFVATRAVQGKLPRVWMQPANVVPELPRRETGLVLASGVSSIFGRGIAARTVLPGPRRELLFAGIRRRHFIRNVLCEALSN